MEVILGVKEARGIEFVRGIIKLKGRGLETQYRNMRNKTINIGNKPEPEKIY